MTHKLSEAEIFSPERSNGLLGDGWKWSERYIGKVLHEESGASIVVEGGSVWFNSDNSTTASLLIENTGVYPYIKMVLLTYSSSTLSEEKLSNS